MWVAEAGRRSRNPSTARIPTIPAPGPLFTCSRVFLRCLIQTTPAYIPQFVSKKRPGKEVSSLKLHRPAAAYTQHPLWAQLSAPHLSFEETCSLLVSGLGADFLKPARAAVGKRCRAARASAQQSAADPSVVPAGTPRQQAAVPAMKQRQQQQQQQQRGARAEQPQAGAAAAALERPARWIEYPAGSGRVATRVSRAAAT